MTASETFGDHALTDAPTVARVFLPLINESDSTKTVPWGSLQHGAPVEFTSDVSWIDYLRWGTGEGSFDTVWRPSMGRAPDATINGVARLLANISGSMDNWVLAPFPDISPLPDAPPPGSLINLNRFAALWNERPLPGSVCFNGFVLVSAPAYADSVIVSGPSRLVEVGNSLGLEIKTVSKRTSLPNMVW